MKIFLITKFLILNSYLFSENIKYKFTNDNQEGANYYTLEYPKDCEKILEIKKSKIYEFKNKKDLNKVFTQCAIYVKGKNVKESVQAGSGAIIKTGKKVKEGVVKGTSILTESIAKETEFFIDDTIKFKDSIVKETGNVIGRTVAKGIYLKDGVSSFFKGILSFSE